MMNMASVLLIGFGAGVSSVAALTWGLGPRRIGRFFTAFADAWESTARPARIPSEVKTMESERCKMDVISALENLGMSHAKAVIVTRESIASTRSYDFEVVFKEATRRIA